MFIKLVSSIIYRELSPNSGLWLCVSERQGVGFTLSVLQAFLRLWPLEFVTQRKGEGTRAACRNLDRYSGICIRGRTSHRYDHTPDLPERKQKVLPAHSWCVSRLALLFIVKILLNHGCYEVGQCVELWRLKWQVAGGNLKKRLGRKFFDDTCKNLFLLRRCPDFCTLRLKAIAPLELPLGVTDI